MTREGASSKELTSRFVSPERVILHQGVLPRHTWYAESRNFGKGVIMRVARYLPAGSIVGYEAKEEAREALANGEYKDIRVNLKDGILVLYIPGADGPSPSPED
jgi:hypothetical protein